MRKITFYINTGFVGANYETTIEVPDDAPDSELSEMAEDFLYDHIDYGWCEEED